MSMRWVLVVLLIGVSCKASGVEGAKVRPAGAGPVTKPAGAVLFAQGETRVIAAGKAFPARKGFALDRSDELVVDLEGILLLELANGYVVRVDEDLRLAVRDLALLDAPPPQRTLEDQVAGLFTPEERAKLPERIVGFQARVAGAESPGASRESKAMATRAAPARRMKKASLKEDFLEEEERAPSPRASIASGMAKAMPPPPPPSPARAAAPAAALRVAPAADEVAVSATLDAPAAPAAPRVAETDSPAALVQKPAWAWGVLNRGRLQPRADALPAPVAEALEAELGSCLREQLGALGLKLEQVRLLVQVRDGRVHRVTLDHGLAAPACAGGLVGREVVVKGLASPAWLAVEVPLR